MKAAAIILFAISILLATTAFAADGDPVLQGSAALSLGTATSVAGTIVLHDEGTVTFHDDGNTHSVVFGPVADGTTILGITGSIKPGTLTLGSGSITDTSGAISFGDENLSTTGTLGAGATTVTSITAGAAGTVAGNAVLHDAGTITMYDDGNNTSVQIGPVGDDSTTLAISGGITLGTALPIASGGTGAATAQAAIDALTAAGVGTIGHVLTLDGSNNAVWAASAAASAPTWGAIDETGTTPSSEVVTTGGSIYVGVTYSEGNATVSEFAGNSVGDVLIVTADPDNLSTVTISDGTYLKLQSDFLLDSIYDSITLLCVSDGAHETFIELARANNATDF